MSKGKKLVFVILCIMFAMLTLGSVITIAFVTGVQTSNSSVNVMYQSNDVYVRIKANYYLGSNAVAMVNGNSTEVVLSPINHIGSLDQPDVDTTSVSMDVDSGGKIVFEYIFENLSDSIPAIISQMTNEDGTPYVPKDSNDNVNLQYVGTSKVMGASAFGGKDTISNIALLPLSTKYIYVIVSVRDLMYNVKFRGSFGWILTKADLVDNTTENVSGGTIISGTDDADVVNKDEMDKVNLVLDCENDKPNYYPQKANKCFTGWYTKDGSGNETEVEWPALITSSTKIYPKYENETKGLSYTYTGDGYAIVGGYNGSTSNIFVPDIHNDGTHGNAKITSIAASAFRGNTKITNLTVPDTVTTIGQDAFFQCTTIVSVYIPRSVTSIGLRAFGNCNKLTSIVVDPDNPVYDSRNNCNGIVETQEDKLVHGCQTTIITNGIKIIGGAFDRIETLTSIDIPDSVTEISAGAFNLCTALQSVRMSNNVVSIGQYAFSGTIVEYIYIPVSCVSISKKYALSSFNLQRIVVDSGNTVYDSRDNCNAVIETKTNILVAGCMNTIIPDSVIEIGAHAFDSQKGLTKLYISKNVKKIASSAFDVCPSIAEIVVDSANTTFDSRDNCNAIIQTATNTLIKGCVNSTIPNTVTAIGDNAFYRTALSDISIPNGVKSIGENAFAATYVKNILIPASVSSIASKAFAACPDLTSIVVDSANATYDSRNNCNAIIEKATNALIVACKTSTIPNTVVTIGKYAFQGIIIDSITLPASVTKIDEWAFYGSTISSITLPSNLTTIGASAFYICRNLTSIVIPASVQYINKQAFQGCGSINSVEFKNSTGWKAYASTSYTNGEEIALSATDFYSNATKLLSVYKDKYWKKD